MAFRPNPSAVQSPTEPFHDAPSSSSIVRNGWVFEEDDRWKAVSHLQKCVRRGWADRAAQAVEWLWALHPEYTRHRMAVMAFEDVAGGNPDLVAASMDGGWKKKVLAERGVQWLADQVHAWARGTKDRTANEWGGCARWLNDYEQRFGGWADQTFEDAWAVAWDDTSPWWAKGLAAWRCAGTERFPNDHLPKVAGEWERWLNDQSAMGISPAMVACMRAGGATQREWSPLFLGLCEHAQRHEGHRDVRINLLNLGDVGPWCSASLDKHTSEGKKAIDGLIRRHPEWESWATSQGWDRATLFDAIGRLQFWMEGGQVDQSKAYATSQTIGRDIKGWFEKRWGIAGSDLFQRVGTVTTEWHEARVQATVCRREAPPLPSGGAHRSTGWQRRWG